MEYIDDGVKYRGFVARKNAMDIIYLDGKPIRGFWVYGTYHKHIKRQIAACGDVLRPEDIEHLIIRDGFADWGMPKQLEVFNVIPETIGRYAGFKSNKGKPLYVGDIISGESYPFSYKGKINYFGAIVPNSTLCPIAIKLYKDPERDINGNPDGGIIVVNDEFNPVGYEKIGTIFDKGK